MRKLFVLVSFIFGLSSASYAQLMVSKLVGKNSSRFGLGYGLFTYLEFPRPSENQSFRIELMELSFYPTKGEKFFTSTAGARGYVSIKLGYKYVFSETAYGFYLLPSAGYCQTVFLEKGQSASNGYGYAAALEGGYSLEVGQNGHSLNFGLKYEYDHGGSVQVLQTVGCRISYAFNMFQRRDY